MKLLLSKGVGLGSDKIRCGSNLWGTISSAVKTVERCWMVAQVVEVEA